MKIELSPVIRAESFNRNPYPVYRQLREAGPVILDEGSQTVGLFGYDDVARALRDPRLKAARSDLFLSWLTPERQEAFAALAESQRNMMLFSDPPGHTRLRGLVNKAFTPRVVDAMRERIAAIVDDVLRPLDAHAEFDVIDTIAYPLPVLVILDLLGVPGTDRDRLKRLSDAFAAFIGGSAGDPGVPEAANAGILELNAYFREAIARKRREPGPDLISGLIAAEEQGTVLSEDEMLATCVIILVAGHETTTNLIGNGLLALLRDDLARATFLTGNAPRVATDELLRYDSPVQITSRLVSEPMRLRGYDLEPGSFVDIWLGAANRDPAQFSDPERLDLARMDNRHLAFGYGIHFCVGAPLARLEGEIALTALLRRFPALRLEDGPIDYHGSLVFRALKRLDVSP